MSLLSFIYDKIAVFIVSLISGIYNVLRDRTDSVSHKGCAFLLGFGFCFGVIMVAQEYGFSSSISAFLGYVCGVLSNQIYDALSRIVSRTPKIVEKKIRGR